MRTKVLLISLLILTGLLVTAAASAATFPVSSGGAGAACSSNNDCDGQMTCPSGVCVRPDGNLNGEACKLSADCASDVCNGASGGATGTCGGTPGSAGSTCSSNNDCDGQMTCTGGVCRRPDGNLNGEACKVSDDCASDNCVGASGSALGTCAAPSSSTPGSVGSACTSNNQCDGLMTCPNGVCRRPNGNEAGETCKAGADCRSGACQNGKCLAPGGGGNTGTPGGGGSGGGLSGAPGRDLTIKDVFNIIVGLTCWLTRMAIFLIVIFVMYYGFLFMKAQGDPAKVTEAKKAFLWGIVGIIVILGTYSIIATVAHTVGGTAGRINPIPINCSGF